MKEYDLISLGTGSAMSIVEAMIQENPDIKVAVIDKDKPGGICLTRGCIPSKILLYPAELVRTIGRTQNFGIETNIKRIDFEAIMNRMRNLINKDIEMIRRGLSSSENIDYYQDVAQFVAPHKLKVGDEIITSTRIFLCTGSKPLIPPIKGLQEAGYLTSKTVLELDQLPESLAVIGGGYIAAEYGHFFSAMGSEVTIVGRNPQFLPEEEPEISALAERELQRHLKIITNHEVRKVEKKSSGGKRLIAFDMDSGERIEVTAKEILVATGRASNTDILHLGKGGIEVDERGWIIVDEYLETSQSNVWALGDANGKHPFKHVANYEASVVYHNAMLNKKRKVDYHAVPHAVFTYPEIASVGQREKEALEKYGKDAILIGVYRYQDTAKGEALDVKDYFVKVIVEAKTMKILGGHIIGPHASILIHEIINLMYSLQRTAEPIFDGMHIHPALNEVVERAFHSLMPPKQYHHVIEQHYELVSH